MIQHSHFWIFIQSNLRNNSRNYLEEIPELPLFTAALFITAKTKNQHKCLSMDEWIKKVWYICLYMCIHIYIYNREYYSSMFIPIGNYSNWENIDGPGFHYVSEINETYTVKKKKYPFRTGKLLPFFIKNSKFQPTISLK